MPIINKRAILDKLTRPTKKMENELRKKALAVFRDSKDKFFDEFNADEVTEELKAGESPDSDPSGILGGRSGNLFAFIGFHAGSDPTKELKEFLDENMRFVGYPNVVKKPRSVLYSFTVLVPTMDEIYNATPYPEEWNGGSWVRGVEKGIPNLRYYLYSDEKEFGPNSRSTFAIQSKKVIKSSPSSAKGRPYISKLLEDFEKRLK